jgi:hypothetical protein
MNKKDQQLLEEAYKKIKIFEQEEISLVLSQNGSLSDFLKNFEGMTLKQFKDKESYYSLYQLNKHNGYADKDTPEGLLTDLIFTLGRILSQEMFIKHIQLIRKELEKKYKIDEFEAQRREYSRQKYTAKLKYQKDSSLENKKALEDAEKAEEEWGKSWSTNPFDGFRREERKAEQELNQQVIASKDLFPQESWSEESKNLFEKLKGLFEKVSSLRQ